MLGQLQDDLQHGGVVDRLEVVEEQCEGLGSLDPPFNQLGDATFQQRGACAGCRYFEGSAELGDQVRDVVMRRLEREPGMGRAERPEPLRMLQHGGGLAEAGRRAEYDQAHVPGRTADTLAEPFTLDLERREHRRVGLHRRERVAWNWHRIACIRVMFFGRLLAGAVR
ncbi:hypothetical protein D3C81_1481390 [compost metagenome]